MHLGSVLDSGAQTEMKIWCVKAMYMLKVVSNGEKMWTKDVNLIHTPAEVVAASAAAGHCIGGLYEDCCLVPITNFTHLYHRAHKENYCKSGNFRCEKIFIDHLNDKN